MLRFACFCYIQILSSSFSFRSSLPHMHHKSSPTFSKYLPESISTPVTKHTRVNSPIGSLAFDVPAQSVKVPPLLSFDSKSVPAFHTQAIKRNRPASFYHCRDSRIKCLWAPAVSYIGNYLVTQIWGEVDPGENSRGPELAPKKRPTFAYLRNRHFGSGEFFSDVTFMFALTSFGLTRRIPLSRM